MDLYPSNDTTYAAQSASYTGTANSTTGWPVGPKGVLVWTTTDAYVRVGDGVTATTASTPVPAFAPLLFEVPPGTGTTFRVSAIQISANGIVYAKPLGGV